MYSNPTRLSHSTVSGASLLVRKLWIYRGTDSILASVTPVAANVTAALSKELNLPHYTHYCKALSHPGNTNRTIGSITSREVIVHDTHASLPQGYIEHQVALMKHLLRREDFEEHPETKDKRIIVVHEAVEGEDQVSAVVAELRKSGARSVILATPLISRRVLPSLESLVDELVYGSLHQTSSATHGSDRGSQACGCPTVRLHVMEL